MVTLRSPTLPPSSFSLFVFSLSVCFSLSLFAHIPFPLPPSFTILRVQAKKLTSKILQAKIMFSQKNLRSPKACKSAGTISHFLPSWLMTHLFLQPTGPSQLPTSIFDAQA